jgi:hypothetical protein
MSAGIATVLKETTEVGYYPARLLFANVRTDVHDASTHHHFGSCRQYRRHGIIAHCCCWIDALSQPILTLSTPVPERSILADLWRNATQLRVFNLCCDAVVDCKLKSTMSLWKNQPKSAVLSRVTLATATSPKASICVNPVVAQVSDAVGRKPVLVVMCGTMALARLYSARRRAGWGRVLLGSIVWNAAASGYVSRCTLKCVVARSKCLRKVKK